MRRIDTRNAERGFSLPEIMIALVILAVLMAIAVPIFNNQRTAGTELELKSMLLDSRSELVEEQVSKQGSFPDNLAETLLPQKANRANVIFTYALSPDKRHYCIKLEKSSVVMTLDDMSREPASNACSVIDITK